ncbi:MAG: glycoside hydrolase family 3 N-terminal domain-containing protein [Parachlamydiaceae bacterium]
MHKKYCFLSICLSLFAQLFSFHDSTIPYHIYKDAVKAAVERMTLDEKIGQMTLVKYAFLQPTTNQIDYDLINRYHLGAVLAAGGEVPNGVGGVNDGLNDQSVNLNEPQDYLTSTAKNWIAINGGVHAHPVVTEKGDVIPLLIGVDAVHGHSIVLGNVIYPHNIGLSMSHDPSIIYDVGYWTAKNALATGFNWVYAPTVAISHNPDWGRTYESLGSVPELTKAYTTQLVNGFQQPRKGKITGVLATVKHYLGDGATYDGPDEGNVVAHDTDHFMQVNKAGYDGAIISGAGSIMISYSGLNNLPMSFNQKLISGDLLKGKKSFKKPFEGLIVSDYGAVDKAAVQGLPTTTTHTPYPQALAKAINSGIDLVMLSSTSEYEHDLPSYLALFKQLVLSGAISKERIDEAVTRILAVKYAMGLVDVDSKGALYQSERPSFPNREHKRRKCLSEIKTALKAAEESLVLLKNDQHLLPIEAKKIKYIVLLGTSLINAQQNDGTYVPTLFANYDNIGIQTGGWTISWQGIEGNDFWYGQYKKSSGATSLLDGIKNVAPGAAIITSLDQLSFYPDMNWKNTIMVGVLAEPPYAEFMGDINSPFCVNSTDCQHGCLYNNHLNPYLPLMQKQTLAIDFELNDQYFIETVKNIDSQIPLITVLFSGRPMIIQEGQVNPLNRSDAFIAAWLPGTLGGQAVANALFGHYLFCRGNDGKRGPFLLDGPNRLTVNWVREMKQLKHYPVYNKGDGFVAYKHPLFKIGYGLATQKKR